ncbi:lipase 1 [Aedes aegypti]|uniref:Partial AB-hydrolase lipase domain-containing protein n=1 Tax=Aedes aegypti TaxID=7159 RepID=A0A1S4F3A4_AEDAE|nr:lipase 1 [Aedes aegypti]
MFCRKKKNCLGGCLVLLVVGVAMASSATPPSKTLTNAARYGLAAHRHHVITHDGYRLALYRIRSHAHARGIVLLQHGIRQSSADWLMIDRNLPMQLLEAGFEVWLGNSRASPETVHIKHLRNSTEFWDFSFNEIGYLDLPAMIDTVLTVARRSSLQLVGFSEGSTASLILLSERVSYNAKVASLNVIAPATFMINSLIKQFAYIYETFRDSFPVSLQELVTGSEKPLINSAKQLEHFHQLLVTGRFRHFDYGEWDNVKYYGVERPPPYSLWRITTPVTVHYGTADGIVPPDDVRNLAMQLHKSTKVRIVQHDRFDHRDFMMQPDAAVRVYPRVVYAIVESSH